MHRYAYVYTSTCFPPSKHTGLTVSGWHSTRRSELPPPHRWRLRVHPAENRPSLTTWSPSVWHPTHRSSSLSSAPTAGQPPNPASENSHRGPPGLSFFGTKTHLPSIRSCEWLLLMWQSSQKTLGEAPTYSPHQNPLQRSCCHSPVLCTQGLLSKTKGKGHLFFIFCLLSAPPLSVPGENHILWKP